MIRVSFKAASGHVLTVEGEVLKPVLEDLSALGDVFEAQDACGACQGSAIGIRVRTVDDNKYYELVCRTCHATFSFGQHKKGGTLFPKFKEGWRAWAPKPEGE